MIIPKSEHIIIRTENCLNILYACYLNHSRTYKYTRHCDLNYFLC